jgi:SAM-dependent methyltransferase
MMAGGEAASVTPQVPDYDVVWHEIYGDWATLGPAQRHLRRLVGEVLAGLDYRSAVDVGCGAGHNLPQLSEGRRLDRLAGVDISAVALAEAKRRFPECELDELDIERGHLDGTYDLVFSSLLLEHVPDDEAALANMRAMTGRDLLVTTVGGDFERYRAWDERVGHVRNYAEGELEEKLRRAGFEPRTTIRWGFPFYSPLARRLQNRMTLTSEMTPSTKLLARIAYGVYFLNSRRRGDLLVVHAVAL